MTLLNTLQTQLTLHLQHTQQAIVVAYSGGVDSHVLLHALHLLRQQGVIKNPVSAIHVHHGISRNADAWAQHCIRVCQLLDIPVQIAKVVVREQKRQSLEAIARDARYKQLNTLSQPESLVLLGQHQDDQLETFLLQLKRGAGPKGLASMAAYYAQTCLTEPQKKVYFLRPLLSVSQLSILNYAKQYQLQWVEDESNQNIQFDRNFLRHNVLPILSTKWPEIAQSVTRSASLCAEQQALLDEVCLEKLQNIEASDNSLSIAALNTLSDAWLAQVVRLWLRKQAISAPAASILKKLKVELLLAKEDANPMIQWASWQLRRFDQQLYVMVKDEPIAQQTLVWQASTPLSLPAKIGLLHYLPADSARASKADLLFDPTQGALNIHFGGFGQRFTPQESDFSKPLKQWYKEWKIPPWQRDKIALITQQAKPLALLIKGQWCKAKPALSHSIDESSANYGYLHFQQFE